MSLVSVVVPVHDGERHLADALGSVTGQTHGDLEVIVVDDGSTDHSAAVAAGFGPPVRVVVQARAGPGAARNAGVAHARGSLLAFIDADDVWEPDKLAAQVAVVQDDDDVDMVFGYGVEFVTPELDPVAAARLQPRDPMPAYLPSALLVRARSFHRTGPFATDLVVGEWVDWYARAQEHGLRHAVVPQLVVRRRLHGANQGIAERAHRGQYLHVLKAALDRRRTAEV